MFTLGRACLLAVTAFLPKTAPTPAGDEDRAGRTPSSAIWDWGMTGGGSFHAAGRVPVGFSRK